MRNLRWLTLALVLALPFGAGLARAQGFAYHAYADTGLKNAAVDSSQFIVPVNFRSGWTGPNNIADTTSGGFRENPCMNFTIRNSRGLYKQRAFIKCEWLQITILSRQSLRSDSNVRVRLYGVNQGSPTSHRAGVSDIADTVGFMIPTYQGAVTSRYVQYDSLKVFLASADTLSYQTEMAGGRLVRP